MFNSVLRTTLMGTSLLILTAGLSTITQTNLLNIQPAIAQRISPSEIWQQVYQQLPDFPKENQYINKQTGKVAENNTLASRLIRYHIYIKERAPNYRLDWKLTLADYLEVNEAIYEPTYPGNEIFRQNPLEGDRTAIKRLNRRQRDTLVQVLTNIFNSSQSTRTSQPNTTNPATSTTPKPAPTGGAQLLK